MYAKTAVRHYRRSRRTRIGSLSPIQEKAEEVLAMNVFKTLEEALTYHREDLPPDQARRAETVLEVTTTENKNAFVISTNYRRSISSMNRKKPEGIRAFLSVAYDFREAKRKDKEKRIEENLSGLTILRGACLLYTSPSPRDRQKSRMPSSA